MNEPWSSRWYHPLLLATASMLGLMLLVVMVADVFADHFADGFGFVEQGFLGQVAYFDARLRACLALDILIDPGHDFQQRGFAGAVQPQHADFGSGEKTQGNIAQYNALGRHDLANPVHGVNELSHLEPFECIARTRGGSG